VCWNVFELDFFLNLSVVDESTDLSKIPALTFGDVEEYAKMKSGCTSTTKAYKFCAEPGYLHNIKGRYLVRKNEYCSMYCKDFFPPNGSLNG